MRPPPREPRLARQPVPIEGCVPMSKRGNKRRARKKKGANHGKRPNA
ncbi:hypothetical protein GPZ77_16545 [Streptomyces sp. QHH-9511]|nr:hypothetical protein GPZ77_16545 [Streptomyces sp. QHH-9511]